VKTVAVILAARAEKGLGLVAALAEHEGGRSFLRSLSSSMTKAGCSVLGVIGDGAERVVEWHPGAQLVEASAWEERPGSALQVGLAAAKAAGAERILVHPVDMPAVRVTTLKALVAKPLSPGEAIRPTFEGASGFPVVLTPEAADRLMGMDAAQTPEQMLAALKPRPLVMKDPGVVVRIRDGELYERLLGHPPKEAPAPKRRGRRELDGESGTMPFGEVQPSE